MEFNYMDQRYIFILVKTASHKFKSNLYFFTQLFTMTGYEGKERFLVKHMINFLGAQYTGYLTKAHAFLVCKKYVIVNFLFC